MPRLYRFLFIILSIHIALIVPHTAHSSHLIGGEMSYICLGGDSFKIKLMLYQDCEGGVTNIILNDNPAYYAIYENSPAPALVRAGEVVSKGNRIVPPEFSNDCISNFPNVCLREDEYEFIVRLPPSDHGYTVVYQRCCRNTSILNVGNPGTIGVTYFTTIPPFTANECPNNSPVFRYPPPQIICSHNPFAYNFVVDDADGDSMVYRLCEPLIGASLEQDKPAGSNITPPPFTPVGFFPPYSYMSPINSFPPLVINPATGMMNGYPLARGRFLVNVCVDEYKNGVRINTHSREVQFIITDCSKNVVANTPLFSDEPNTYIINCSDYTVHFQNTSIGGHSYEWNFGDGSPPSSEFQPYHTYEDTGTYLVKLYVNKGSSCSDSISRIVKIYPEIIADFEWEGNLCPGDTIRFYETVISTLGEEFEIFWDLGNGQLTGDSNPQTVYEDGGDYNVTLTVSTPLGCRVDYNEVLPVRDFRPDAGNDTVIVLGYEFNLNAQGGDVYQWFPSDYLSDPYISNPRVSFPDTGYYSYRVRIGTEESCQGEDSINILVVREASLLLPNAFSPNGDGLNDIIKPQLVGYRQANYFRIFNRYGQQVFVSYSHHQGWDGTYNGKKCDPGVYFYELNVEKIDGSDTTLTGDITLIR